MSKEPHERGLPSLTQARAERRRALVFGKARLRAMSPRFWLWTAMGFAVFFVIYWKVVQGRLESEKSAVMAKQRAVAQELGSKIIPWRDRIEGWVVGLAGEYPRDEFAGTATYAEVARAHGVYLRLRLADAGDARSIRSAAVRSLQDGFTSCMFVRSSRVSPREGNACASPADCEPGFLCNEWDVCARPTQPYNLRLAYRALRILSTEWTDELHRATNDLTVRAHERDLDRATHDDVPIAIELMTRARFFTLVLDEDPAGGLAPSLADAGVDESVEQRVQRTPHMARVGIWNLQTGEVVARYRGAAAGRFVPMGSRVVDDPRVVAAQQRQVNSCALAMGVKQAMTPPPKPAAADAGATPSPDAAAR